MNKIYSVEVQKDDGTKRISQTSVDIAFDKIPDSSYKWWNGSTPLMIACQIGSVNNVQKLIASKDIDINAKNNVGNTGFMIAAEYGHVHILKLLLKTYEENTSNFLHSSNIYGHTALMLAIEKNRIEVVRYLVPLDISQLYIKNSYKKHALLIAAEFGWYDIFIYLYDEMLKKEGDYTFVDNIHTKDHEGTQGEGNRVLMYACGGTKSDHEKIAIFLLNLSQINVNLRGVGGSTAINWASKSGSFSVVQKLIQHKSFKDCEFDQSVLETLCKGGHANTIQLYLTHFSQNGKLVDFSDGTTWMHYMSGLRISLMQGNIKLATGFFMISQDSNNTYSEDMLLSRVDGILSPMEQQEMFHRMSGNALSVRLLFKLGALYHFHFDLLLKYLHTLDSHIAILDENLPVFLQCLEKGCNTSDAWFDINDIIRVGTHYEGEYASMEFEEHIKFPNHLTDVDVVNKLVELAILLRHISKRKSIELQDDLQNIENILKRCLSGKMMGDMTTLQKFLPSNSYQKDTIVRHAVSFMIGPLAKCIRNKISQIFNSGYVNAFVNELYWGFMREQYEEDLNAQNRILKKMRGFVSFMFCLQDTSIWASDIRKLRSRFIGVRFNPSGMFFLEGFSKCVLLCMIVRKACTRADDLNVYMWLMLITQFLYEYGELCDNRFLSTVSSQSVRSYFSSTFNWIDLCSNALVGTSLVMEYIGNPYAPGCMSLSVIFASIAMLNYLGSYEPVGQLIIMIFAMMSDLVKFAVIFVVCVFGFCVALYSLAKPQSRYPVGGSFGYKNKLSTVLTMLNMVMGSYNENYEETYPDYDDPFRSLSIGIEIVYIVFGIVILLNLVIARMSATHDRIDKKSFEEWQFSRAVTAYSFLLMNERSPFSMMPCPFNLISLIVAVLFDFPRFYYYSKHKKYLGKNEFICWSGSISDWILGIGGSVLGPFLELCIYCNNSLSSSNHNYFENFYIILFFPLIYPFYVIALLVRTVNLATKISLIQGTNDKIHYGVVFNETRFPESVEEGDSVLSIRILRISGIELKRSGTVVQVIIQNIAASTGECLRENNTVDSYLVKDGVLQFPFKQINMNEKLQMKICVANKNFVTGQLERKAIRDVNDEEVRKWIANGRFEEKLKFGSMVIQVVVNIDIKSYDLISSLVGGAGGNMSQQNKPKVTGNAYNNFIY
jgi:ankyrin repeat protein